MLDSGIFGEIGVLVPVSSLLILLVLTLARIYFSIRRRFNVSVNCWFCNRNERVPYDRKNSFMCRGCDQYNGFGADGGYNREIPEQHYARLNPVTNCVFSEENVYDLRTGNGLCYACNRNQELKVLQLAAFVPESDVNFDLEVEQYKQSLERAYRLCAQCERVVKRAINRTKTKVVGRIGSGVEQKPTRQMHVNILLWVGLALALVNFLGTLRSFEVGRTSLEQWIGPALTEFGLKIYSYGLATKTLIFKYFFDNPICQGIALYWQKPVSTVAALFDGASHDFTEMLNISGTVVTVILIVISEGKNLGLLSCLLFLWTLSTSVHNHKLLIGPFDIDVISVLELLSGFSTLVLSYMSFTASVTFKQENLSQSFHKICPQLEEESETEEFPLNVSAGSVHSVHNTSIRSNRSFASPTDVMSVISKNTSEIDLASTSTYLRHRNVQNPFMTHLNLDRPRSIISPPRLHQNMVMEPSWVGGGFWATAQSPPKKQPANDFVPIESRTSSQSSGFESQMPFSRENSVTKEFEVGSVFSEPVVKPQPVYPPRLTSPVQRNFISPTPSQRNFISPTPSQRNFTSPLFNSQHDTRSLYNLSSRASTSAVARRPPRGSIFNFKKFSTDLPQL